MVERALYGYFRSSTAFRVRIALALKGLGYDSISVHLVRGEQRGAAHRARNPQGRVPTYAEGEWLLSQSPAILEYLEEAHPAPALLPSDPRDRAWVRQLAAVIGCDVHPINNLSVLKYLKGPLSATPEQVSAWYAHWIHEGFEALEALLVEDPRRGRFCYGDAPTLADVYLVPQIWNARRFEVDLSAYPTLQAIEAACYELDAFARARPEHQPQPD